MDKKWQTILLTSAAVCAAGLSIPLYLVALIGVGMSPSKPHLGVPWACILWTPPVIAIAASVALVRAQHPTRLWRWFLGGLVMLLSGVEAVWTLLILLEG